MADKTRKTRLPVHDNPKSEDVYEEKCPDFFQENKVEFFFQLMHHLPVMSWFVCPGLKLGFYNKVFYDFNPTLLSKDNFWQLAIHPEDLGNFDSAFKQCFETRQALEGRFRMLDKWGAYRWMKMNGNPVFTAENILIGFAGSCVDITDQALVTRALLESEKKFRSLAENSPDFIARFDVLGKIIYVNQAILKITGIDLDFLLNKFLKDLPSYNPESCRILNEKVSFVAKSNIPMFCQIEWELKEGTMCLDCKIVPECDANGDVVSILCIAQDISYLKETERKLKNQLEEYSAVNEELTEKNEQFLVLNEQLNQKYFELALLNEEFARSNEQLAEKNEHIQQLFDNLMESEERFHHIFNNMDNGVAIYEATEDGNNFLFIDLNHAGEKYSQVRREDIVGKKLTDVFPGVVEMGMLDVLIRVYKTGRAEHLPLTIYQDEHVFEWVENYVFKLPSGLIVAVYDDTTENHYANEALKAAEQKYRRIVETANESIWAMDKDYVTNFVNQKLCEMLGYTEQEMLGKKVPEFMFDEDLADFALRISGRQMGQNEVYERRFMRKNHQECWCLVSATALMDNSGSFSGSFAMIIDITARKNAEKALHESESRYFTTLYAINDGLWDWNVQTGEAFFSEQYYRMLGYENQEFKANFSSWKGLVHPEDILRVEQQLLEGLKNDEGFAIDLRMRTKSGNYSWIGIRGKVVKQNQQGIAMRAVGTISDIGQRKNDELLLKQRNEEYLLLNEELININQYISKINGELLEAKLKAEESDRLKSAFLANMSHEIRTPMNAIKGFSQLLAQPDLPVDKRDKFIKIIDQRSNDLLKIIEDILDISKIEAGQLKIAEKTDKLYNLLNELHQFYIAQMELDGTDNIELNCNYELTENQSFITTDFLRLKQILINLISNAFKFTSEGFIKFGCRLQNTSTLLFFVQDSGIGIPASKHDLIFERFAQGEESHLTREFGGTGLGLSIVKGLLELMEGKIWFESDLGKGTIFYFTLPYKPVFKILTTENLQSLKTYNWEGKSILIVEDDSHSANLIIEYLSGTQARFKLAASAKRAREMLQKSEGFDIVLMDIRLPDGNGFELTREIRKTNSSTIVIVQSAYATPDDCQMAMDAGCNSVLQKPVARGKLLSEIQKNLESRVGVRAGDYR